MSSVPHGPEVDKAISALSKEVKTALNQLNRQAGMLLAKGRYDKAEALVTKARIIGEFQDKIKVLREDWRQIRRSGRSHQNERDETTPLWEYYHPILETLHAMGGRVRRKDLEKEFESRHLSKLKAGEMTLMAGGVPRWQKMIRKSRKHLIKEGFIEDSTSHFWQITSEGKKAVQSGGPPRS